MKTSNPKFRTPYTIQPKIATIDFHEPSKTKQSFADECDINNVMRKFNSTGQLPDLIKNNPKYGDFSDPMDYQNALNQVIFAQEQFSALSAEVRDRFNNDPTKFLDFATNPKNSDELVKLGLATQTVIPDNSAPSQLPTPPQKNPHKPSSSSSTSSSSSKLKTPTITSSDDE